MIGAELKNLTKMEEVWAVFKEAAKIEINRTKKEYKELLKMQGICNVCTGKPINGRPCICNGAGTKEAELQGLRERVFELESLLKKQEGMVLVPNTLLDDLERKLEIYREYSDGCYHGGIEHTELIKRIAKAKEKQLTQTEK